MKHIVNIFRQNRDKIKKYIFDAINQMESQTLEEKDLKRYFPVFKSLKSIYAVSDNCSQITPLYSKDSQDSNRIDKVITSLRDNMTLDQNGEYMSSAYLSSTDGSPTVTVSKKINDNEVIAMNFNLIKLLEELNYVDKADIFNKMTRFIYALIGYSLSLFSVILIVYSLYNFAYHSLDEGVDIFQSIFKSTIALTLGLAIFDLAKNLLEHEVVYKEHFTRSHKSNKKLLEKFLISIIIALSIEALMTVFKIALSNYKDILYAVYLILAVSVMIFALSYFNKNTN